MVILEKTNTQLKLRHRPYLLWLFLGSWLVGTLLLMLIIHLLHGWWIYFWWMPAFLVVNIVTPILGLLFAGQVVIYHFDKDYHTLSIKRQGLLNTEVISHSLADILDIQVESLSGYYGENTNYQTVIILRSGKSFSVNMGQGFAIDKQLETANLIRIFLGMSPQRAAQ